MSNNDNTRQETIECAVALAEDPQTIPNEPYSISPDGHYVGCDGFVVPKNFVEFYEREPLSVLRFVMKNLRKQCVDDDVKEMEQDLLVHLSCLPKKSKYREQGKTDRIQCFDPERQHGANVKRFHNWVSLCLTNRFKTLMSKRKKNPLFRINNLSYTEVVQDDDGGHRNRNGEVNAEYLHKHSSVVAERQRRCNNGQAHDGKIFIGQYKDFVGTNAPELIVFMDAIAREDNDIEVQEALGMSASDFARNREHLRTLMDCFQSGRDMKTSAQRRRRQAVSRLNRTNSKRRTVRSFKRRTMAR